MGVNLLAEEGGFVDALISSATDAATQLTGVVTKVAPIILGVVVALLVVKKAIGIFKGLFNKAS